MLLNFGPQVLETVYTRFEPSVAHICWKIDKS